jgi:hypothetical protein
MELDVKKVREKMRRCAHDNLSCTLTPEELRAFFADGMVYYECDSCGMLVRTPLQIRKEIGDEWWGGHPSVLAEHKPDCKYRLKLEAPIPKK